jgi:hypothetical protein
MDKKKKEEKQRTKEKRTKGGNNSSRENKNWKMNKQKGKGKYISQVISTSHLI